MEPQHPRSRIPGAVAVAHHRRPDLARRAELGDLLEKVVVAVEEKRQARRERVDVEAGADSVFHVLHAVAERERELLQRRRAGLADMVAGDRNRVPLRNFRRRERKLVGDQPHRWTRRIDVLLLRDVLLQNVVLQRSGYVAADVDSLALRHREVHREQDWRRRIDGHRRRDLAQRNAGEQSLHVGERVDRDAALPHLSGRHLVIGVVAVKRRQMEGDREPGLALRQEVLEPAVGVGRRTEASELTHGPELAAVAGGVNAAYIRELAGHPDLRHRIQADLLRRDERRDGHSRDRREVVLPGRVAALGSRAFGFPAHPRGGGTERDLFLKRALSSFARRRSGGNAAILVGDGHLEGLLGTRGTERSSPALQA